MSCRRIVDKGDYIIKFSQPVKDKEWLKTIAILEQHRSELEKETFLSAFQTLNEINIYNLCTTENRELLAPIFDHGITSKNELYIIEPHFTPIVDEKKAYGLTEDQSSYLLNKVIENFSEKWPRLKTFVKDVDDLCGNYDLCKDDIFFNLSNFGYNSTYGLRVIDYGLTERLAALFIN